MGSCSKYWAISVMKWLAISAVALWVIYEMNQWKIPAEGLKYAPYFADAEKRHGLPHNLLARVAFQESSFREDVITGDTVSSAGAVGLMQIVPKWHPGVDPTNPIESIYYAAGYLARLYKQFGDWELALAAYNWGPGNVRRRGMDEAPMETLQYVAQITNDVRVA